MSNYTGRLDRLFNATEVAVVGASDNGMRSRNAIEAMTRTSVRLHLVNRRGEDVMGLPTARSLTDLVEQGAKVDAAIIFTNAVAAVDVTAEAASLGVGGVIVNAGGFAEAGDEGAALQDRLVRAAGEMPVLGPNCNGIVSPSLGLHLAGSPPNLPVGAGGLAFVTHSGATMMPMGIAGVERKTGFRYLVSTGNEAAVDMAEVVDYLATDDRVSAICLLIETIRNPTAFWNAVDRAISAGKPVLALKNGRSSRGQEIAKSHTGAVTGEAWVYEAALRQHGVVVANDLVDLADRSVLFEQIPPTKWTAVAGLAIASGSGGWVTMASDVCAEEQVELPSLDDLRPQINQTVPEATVVNPLDLTGKAMTDPRIMEATLQTFLGSDAVDSVLIQSAVADGAEDALNAFAGPALAAASQTDKLLVVGSIEGGTIGKELDHYLDAGIGVTRGLRATIRALRSMGDFVAYRRAQGHTAPLPDPRPEPGGILEHPTTGRMLGFDATMSLLADAGVPIAPYVVLGPDQDPSTPLPFDGPYVVKLADVPHRSDIGAVLLGISRDQVPGSVEQLRDLAARNGESPAVTIQPQYRISSELLVGINGANELGPIVVCGLGGVFVEVLRQVAGRLAPFSVTEAESLVDDVNTGGVLDGPRGTAPWPRHELATLLSAVGDLAASAPWIESLDINPLALTDHGIVAVDGLVILGDTVLRAGDGPDRATETALKSTHSSTESLMNDPEPAAEPFVLYTVEDGVATITLNRPDQLNPISHGPNSMQGSIVDRLTEADQDDAVGCVVITGSGRAFSSGGPIVGGTPPEHGIDWYWFLTEEDVDNERIRALRKPVIGAINGLCYGAAFMMACHFDILIASSEARLGLIETRFGGTGAEALNYLVGPQWAKFLALSGELITADKAKEIGLVLEVVPPESLKAKAHDLGRRIAAMPRDTMIMNRRLINYGMDVTGWTAQKQAGMAFNAVTNSRFSEHRAWNGERFSDLMKQGFKTYKTVRDEPFKTSWFEKEL